MPTVVLRVSSPAPGRYSTDLLFSDGLPLDQLGPYETLTDAVRYGMAAAAVRGWTVKTVQDCTQMDRPPTT